MGKIDESYDMELPSRFRENKEFYEITIFLLIPGLVIGSIWYKSMIFGALVLSALVSLMCIDVIISQDFKRRRGGMRTAAYSAVVVFLSAWSPLVFFLPTPYYHYIIAYTSIWFSIGMYSIIRKFYVWVDFWKNGFSGILGEDKHKKEKEKYKHEKGGKNG